MKKTLLVILCNICIIGLGFSQTKVMTPEQLIELNRVSAVGISKDGKQVIYKTSTFDLATEERARKTFVVSVEGGEVTTLEDAGDLVNNPHTSPDGKWKLVAKDVKIQNISGVDHYEDVPNSNVYIYDALNYRHWDTWEDGAYSHIFIQSATDTTDAGIDLMEGMPLIVLKNRFAGGKIISGVRIPKECCT